LSSLRGLEQSGRFGKMAGPPDEVTKAVGDALSVETPAEVE
jgi:hypothetical protein